MLRLAPRCARRALAAPRRAKATSPVEPSSGLAPLEVNSSVIKAEYAVRGRLLAMAAEFQARLDAGDKSLPFADDGIVLCNIGNPQALRQPPITFFRQVLAGALNPSPELLASLPGDAAARAEEYLGSVRSMGAYTDTKGIVRVREQVAAFLGERDGATPPVDSIFLTGGASQAADQLMLTLLRNRHEGYLDGIMAPVPQYPLYQALATLMDAEPVGYYLDEDSGWGLDVEEMRSQLAAARARGVDVRAVVVINPGNPTGAVLPEAHLRDVVRLCAEEELVLIADEVYQENVWAEGKEFVSMRKVAEGMGLGQDSGLLRLVTLHSTSKGFIGECGLRGGFMQLQGFDDAYMFQQQKLGSLQLCSNTVGQVAMGLMVAPPSPGDESHALYVSERASILESMKRRAVKLASALNSLEGISCPPADGAMYAFPRLHLPAAAVAAAGAQAPDEYYCMRLLEATGVVVVPGSGFGQREGTHHLRITCLPPEDQIDNVIRRFTAFHAEFMDKFRD